VEEGGDALLPFMENLRMFEEAYSMKSGQMRIARTSICLHRALEIPVLLW
jgi:hypothetical protein